MSTEKKERLKRRAHRMVLEFYAERKREKAQQKMHGDDEGDHATLLSDASDTDEDADADDEADDEFNVDEDARGELSARDVQRYKDVLDAVAVKDLSHHRNIAPKGAGGAWLDRAKRLSTRRLRRWKVMERRARHWRAIRLMDEHKELASTQAAPGVSFAELVGLSAMETPPASDEEEAEAPEVRKFRELQLRAGDALDAHVRWQEGVDEEAAAMEAGGGKEASGRKMVKGYTAAVKWEDIDTSDAESLAGGIVSDDGSLSGTDVDYAAVDGGSDSDDAADAVDGMDAADRKEWWGDVGRQCVMGAVWSGYGAGLNPSTKTEAGAMGNTAWAHLMGTPAK
jgi:hypothetical protein